MRSLSNIYHYFAIGSFFDELTHAAVDYAADAGTIVHSDRVKIIPLLHSHVLDVDLAIRV